MDSYEERWMEQSSIEELGREIPNDKIFKKNIWDSSNTALEIIDDGAWAINKITDIALRKHFSPEERKRIIPYLFLVYIDPNAEMKNDSKAPFAIFEAHDMDGNVVSRTHITSRGLSVFIYQAADSDSPFADNAPCCFVENEKPNIYAITMKWILFTGALYYLQDSPAFKELCLFHTSWVWDYEEALNEEE